MFRICVSIFISAIIAGVICSPAHAQLFPQTLRFEISGSYGTVSPDGVNRLLRDHNAFMGRDRFEQIDRFSGVGFSIRQSISSRIVLLVGAGYLRGSTNKAEVWLSDVYGNLLGPTDEQFRLSSIPISAGAGYFMHSKSVALGVDIGGEIHFIRFEHHASANLVAGIPEFNGTWSGTTVGANGAVSAYWNVRSKVFVGIRGGYRITEDAELTYQENGGIGPDPVTADFSGFYLSLFVGMTPWR
jgi:hypothetical protein